MPYPRASPPIHLPAPGNGPRIASTLCAQHRTVPNPGRRDRGPNAPGPPTGRESNDHRSWRCRTVVMLRGRARLGRPGRRRSASPRTAMDGRALGWCAGDDAVQGDPGVDGRQAGVPGPGDSGVGAGLDGGYQTAEGSLTGPLPSPRTPPAQQARLGASWANSRTLRHSAGRIMPPTAATSTSHHGRAHELGQRVHAQGAPARLDRAGCWYP